MKYKLIIKQNQNIVFEGNPIDLPVKKDVLIEKSIEMFDDADPCIMHQTYVVEMLIDPLISKLKKQMNQEVLIADIMSEASFIDVKPTEGQTIILRRK